jgi:hypothetical protein
MEKAETALKGLRDVDGASIQAEDGEIREIHILTSSSRPAKQIVRDVQTLLLTRFGRTIDHRVVSVAFSDPQDDVRAGHELPGPGSAAPLPRPAQAEDRIRFGSANVSVSGARVQAQVELTWKGLPRTGAASGLGTREGALRLVAQAALAAVQEFLEEDVALSLEGLEIVRPGRREVVVVALELIAHREHKTLAGCCAVEQDMPQSVVLATLAAVNRVLGGLPTREPTEYVLRPAST